MEQKLYQVRSLGNTFSQHVGSLIEHKVSSGTHRFIFFKSRGPVCDCVGTRAVRPDIRRRGEFTGVVFNLECQLRKRRPEKSQSCYNYY